MDSLPTWNRCWAAAADLAPVFDTFLDNQALAGVDLSPLDALAEFKAQTTTIVYVPLAALRTFLNDVWPSVHAEVILVTGLSDVGPAASLGIPTLPRWPSGKPDDCITNPATVAPLRTLLSSPNLVAWWSENLDFEHPKARALTIGLDLHTLAGPKAGEKAAWGTPASPSEQARELWMARDAALSTHPWPGREARVYVQFGLVNRRRLAVAQAVAKHPLYAINEGLAARMEAQSRGAGKSLAPDSHLMSRATLWRTMAQYQWVASVEGYGVDCHRTWEALAMGCGVVVQDTPLLRQLLEGLPAYFVCGGPVAWAAVTHDDLTRAWRDWEDGHGGPQQALEAVRLRLTSSYWTDLIRRWRPAGTYEGT